VDAPVALGDVLVPPFLLQPLVENAVRHGRVMRDGQGRVEVRAAESSGTLVLRVEDDGPASSSDAPRGLGVGLRTARERLTLLYGDAAALDAAPRPDGGYRVSLRLPLRRAARAQSAMPDLSSLGELAHARSHR
jgi:two-component system LytT family sensor kinase